MNVNDLDNYEEATPSGSFSPEALVEAKETDAPSSVSDNGFGKKTGDGTLKTATRFPEITKRFEEEPHEFFHDRDYYKTVLGEEGEIAQRVHDIFQKYLTTKDPKDRSAYRQQFILPFWDFLSKLARKAAGKTAWPKKFLLRFGILHPAIIKAEDRDFFGKLIVENELNLPVYYLDEWLKAVGTGVIRPSANDETKVATSNTNTKLQLLQERLKGKFDGTLSLLKSKEHERTELEGALKNKVNAVFEHTPAGDGGVSSNYIDEQRRGLTESLELIKQVFKTDREYAILLREYYQAQAELNALQKKIDEERASVQVNLGAIDAEFGIVRQMSKMSIGRQGNHFPILISEYLHSGHLNIGTRESVITMLSRIESIDTEVFYRYYKSKMNRIAPLIILVPTYGETGFCWEPFDRYNRATSPGRIVIPMYPRNLFVTVLGAVADLRWQVAKEKAAHYWMEEGLTGRYFQCFQKQKLKGDIKEYFISDYILWMTKEADGVQKLSKEVRGIFWRYMPFAQEVKERLKKRNFVYQELYQRDLNRAMSDGY
ncbi:MAG: hypothetical protein FWG66_06175 [Spirochaetes bacterium]|nr:hypothetical protein [Spirochaetota bacterium]